MTYPTRARSLLILAASLLCVVHAHSQTPAGPEDYSYDGFMEPIEDVMVSAVEIGRIDAVLVKVGDRVQAGQELATLENSLQVISLEIAKQQTLMKGEMDAAIAEYNLHVHRTEQLRELAAMGTARPDELSRAETDLKIAEAKVLMAKEEHQNRMLEWKRNEIQLERRRILSPISGVVARVMRRPGEYVSPGDAAIIRVIAKDSLIAVFNLPAADALHLRVGQVVPLRPRTMPRVVNGVVESISPAIDGESGTVGLRIRIDNRDEALLPGDRCVMSNVKQLVRISSDNAAPKRVGALAR
ncbi:MAG: efflux RND transporter periplasmic adaptor subunit [Planctomycetaceae bacterium]